MTNAKNIQDTVARTPTYVNSRPTLETAQETLLRREPGVDLIQYRILPCVPYVDLDGETETLSAARLRELHWAPSVTAPARVCALSELDALVLYAQQVAGDLMAAQELCCDTLEPAGPSEEIDIDQK